MRRLTSLVAMAIATLLSGPVLAGSVTGMVSDSVGNPLAGISVEAAYQTYGANDLLTYGASIKASAVSGPDGRYHIELGHLPPGEYRAHAYHVIENGGRNIVVDLQADDTSNFVSNSHSVRNFTTALVESSADLPYGNGGVFLLQNAILDYTDLSGAEVSLVHLESGDSLTRPVRKTGEGLVLTGIAFGRYRANVTLNGEPLQLRLFGAEPDAPFTASVTGDFTMGYLGNQLIVEARR